MPTGTRLTTPIPRAYLSDSRLASVKDVLAREMFLRAKLIVDNLGRMPGEPAMVAGLLYPVNSPPTSRTAKALAELERAGLILWYRSGPTRFIEIPDSGATMKIIGHMATTSEYPAPEPSLVAKWEKKTGLSWHAVRVARDTKGKDSNGVRTPSEPSSNGVSSRSNGVSLCSEGQCHAVPCSAEQSSVEHDAAFAADSAPDGAPHTTSTLQGKDSDKGSDQTFSQWLGIAAEDDIPGEFVGQKARFILEKIAGGRYDPSLDFPTDDGESWAAFAQLLVDTFERLRDEPYSPLVGDELLMRSVVNESNRDGRVRAGWLKVLNDLRREIKSGDFTNRKPED